MCRNVAKLLGRTLGERICIEIKGESNLWHVLADPAQVESSLINLAVNARDAMTEGGTLTIETSNVTSHGADADFPPGTSCCCRWLNGRRHDGRSAGSARSSRSSPPRISATAPGSA
jgi:signal transduction histidine kinase